MIHQLINLGALVDAEDPHERKTPLMIVCEKGYIMLVDLFLSNNAQSTYSGKFQRTPLHYSIDTEAENEDVVQLLLAKGHCDVNCVTLDGSTPLMIASHRGHNRIMQLLLKNGAQVNLQ